MGPYLNETENEENLNKRQLDQEKNGNIEVKIVNKEGEVTAVEEDFLIETDKTM